MDADQFDAMAKAMTFGASRRRVLAGLLGVGLTGLSGVEGVRAKKKPKKSKPCKKAKDCGVGFTCQDGTCLRTPESCSPPCRRVARLEGGQVCASGLEVRATSQPCQGDEHCPHGIGGTCSIGDCPIAGPCCHYVTGTSQPCAGDQHCTRQPGGICTLEACPIAGPCCHYLSPCAEA